MQPPNDSGWPLSAPARRERMTASDGEIGGDEGPLFSVSVRGKILIIQHPMRLGRAAHSNSPRQGPLMLQLPAMPLQV